MNYFFDTSALIKLYHIELGSKYLENELARFKDDLIITVSDLTHIEFYSVILKKVRIKQLKHKQAQQVFTLFEQDWTELNCIVIDNNIKATALDLMRKFAHTSNLSTLDALQLSVALNAHQVLPIDCFVTADKRLFDFADIHFNTLNPESAVLLGES